MQLGFTVWKRYYGWNICCEKEAGEFGPRASNCFLVIVYANFFPLVLWHCWLGDRKKVWCWFVGGDDLASIKLANPGSPGKMVVKTDRVYANFSALTLFLGWQEGHLAYKTISIGLGIMVVVIWHELLQVLAFHFVPLLPPSSHAAAKSWMVCILVLVYPGCPGILAINKDGWVIC